MWWGECTRRDCDWAFPSSDSCTWWCFKSYHERRRICRLLLSAPAHSLVAPTERDAAQLYTYDSRSPRRRWRSTLYDFPHLKELWEVLEWLEYLTRRQQTLLGIRSIIHLLLVDGCFPWWLRWVATADEVPPHCARYLSRMAGEILHCLQRVPLQIHVQASGEDPQAIRSSCPCSSKRHQDSEGWSLALFCHLQSFYWIFLAPWICSWAAPFEPSSKRCNCTQICSWTVCKQAHWPPSWNISDYLKRNNNLSYIDSLVKHLSCSGDLRFGQKDHLFITPSLCIHLNLMWACRSSPTIPAKSNQKRQESLSWFEVQQVDI